MTEWIKCSDKMPADYQEVIFCFEIWNEDSLLKKDIVCGHHDKNGWYICYIYISYHLTDDDSLIKVTHWMELPEFPK